MTWVDAAFIVGSWVVSLVVLGIVRNTIRQPCRPLPRNPGPTAIDTDYVQRFPYTQL
jgi:hypothetical protein